MNQRSDSPVQARYQTPDRSPLHNVAMESEVKEIRRALRSFMARLQEKDAVAKVMMEWRIVALVLDRLFFCMYLAIIIVSLCTIFPKS